MNVIKLISLFTVLTLIGCSSSVKISYDDIRGKNSPFAVYELANSYDLEDGSKLIIDKVKKDGSGYSYAELNYIKKISKDGVLEWVKLPQFEREDVEKKSIYINFLDERSRFLSKTGNMLYFSVTETYRSVEYEDHYYHGFITKGTMLEKRTLYEISSDGSIFNEIELYREQLSGWWKTISSYVGIEKVLFNSHDDAIIAFLTTRNEGEYDLHIMKKIDKDFETEKTILKSTHGKFKRMLTLNDKISSKGEDFIFYSFIDSRNISSNSKSVYRSTAKFDRNYENLEIIEHKDLPELDRKFRFWDFME